MTAQLCLDGRLGKIGGDILGWVPPQPTVNAALEEIARLAQLATPDVPVYVDQGGIVWEPTEQTWFAMVPSSRAGASGPAWQGEPRFYLCGVKIPAALHYISALRNRLEH